MLRALIFATTLLLSNSIYAFSFTKEFTEAEIQEKVAAMMPLEKKKFFITVIFSNPIVDLLESNNKIGIISDIQVKAPGGIKGKGKAHITGSLSYNNKKGEFYLNNPIISELKVDRVPEKYLPKVKNVAELALKKITSVRPIFKLKDNNLKQKLAKSLLKSIKVEKEKLIVELSPF